MGEHVSLQLTGHRENLVALGAAKRLPSMGELVNFQVFLRGGHLVSGQFSRGDESLPTLDTAVFHLG